jgi:hypothetical protein
MLLAMFLLSAAAAAVAPSASASGYRATLPPAAKRINRGVYPNALLPTIGPITLSRSGGGLAVDFAVDYPSHVARHGVARVRGVVHLQVARRSVNGRSLGTVQRAAEVTKLTTAGRRVHYSFPLSQAAAKWLRGHWSQRGNLVSVRAELGVDVNGDGNDDHLRGAAATMSYSHRPQAASASSDDAENTITLELLNGTKGPIHNISMPVTCMYQDGNEGSDLQLFNVVQGAELSPGGTITEQVAADGDFFSSPEFMSNGEGVDTEVQALHVAEAVAGEFLHNVPLLEAIDEMDDLANDCENNASVFSFTAAEAKACTNGSGCNASTTGGWVMSLMKNTGYIAPPIDSAVAASLYQWNGDADGFDPWGSNWPCPVCNGVIENPSSGALYPLGLSWLSYMKKTPSSPTCAEIAKAGEGLIGDHGLSWRVWNETGNTYVFEVRETGEEDGWSGSNPASPVEGNPEWLYRHPTSYCP